MPDVVPPDDSGPQEHPQQAHPGRLATAPQQAAVSPPALSRRERLWRFSESRGVPLRTILTTVGVVVLVYLAGKLVDGTSCCSSSWPRSSRSC